MRGTEQVRDLFERGFSKARETFRSDLEHSSPLEIAFGHEFLCQKAIGSRILAQREGFSIRKIHSREKSLEIKKEDKG